MSRRQSILPELKYKLKQTKPLINTKDVTIPKLYTSDQAKAQHNVDLPDKDHLLSVKKEKVSYETPSGYKIHDDNTIEIQDGQVLSHNEFL